MAARVREHLGHNPLGGQLFLFCIKNAERVKVLWREGSGLVLYCKRLERGVFRVPAASSETASTIDSMQLVYVRYFGVSDVCRTEATCDPLDVLVESSF